MNHENKPLEYALVVGADRYRSIEAAAKLLDLRLELDEITEISLYARVWYSEPGDLFKLGQLTERYFAKGIG